METITPSRKEDVRDPRGLAGWPKEKGRDGERTPMQWDGSPNAGFSSATQTWLPVETSFRTKNVAAESAEPQSLWNWYLRLIQLKRSNPAVHSGQTFFLNHDAEQTLVWVRKQEKGPAVIVICNMSAQPVTLTFESEIEKIRVKGSTLKAIMSSAGSTKVMEHGRLLLEPFETFLGELSNR